MNSIIDLIQKFQAGNATESERKSLLEALEANDLELKAWLAENYKVDVLDDTKVISSERAAEIFSKIQELKNTESPILQKQRGKLISIKDRSVQWFAAACVIGFIATGILYFNSTKKDGNKKIVTNNTLQLQEYVNITKATMTIVMQDGSTVLVEPKSGVSYYKPFAEKRDISLIGKATFKVAKNANKPFTVYANGISTTALGTVFSVNAFNNKIIVQLFEGKVVVKPSGIKYAFANTYLEPGEQYHINQQNGTYTVSKFNLQINDTQKSIVAKKQNTANNNSNRLEFNRTPLADVFAKVSKNFNTTIQYEKFDFGDATFTGSFLITDSLKNILNIICNTNDLLYKEDKGIIIIYK